jgi:proton glutamate symport protein
LGLIAGYLSGAVYPGSDSRWDGVIYDLLGGLFMNGLKMLIIPLVMSSIIFALGSMGQQAGFARLGIKALAFYTFTSLIAILIGLVLVNTIAPGEGTGISSQEISQAVHQEGSKEMGQMQNLTKATSGKSLDSTLNVFRELIPQNIFEAMVQQKMLGVIVFSILFGYFINQLGEQHREVLLGLTGAIQEVMTKMTFLVLKFLPLGVACLIAKTSSETFASGHALERLFQLSWFALTVISGLGLHAFVVMPLILKFGARVSPLAHFKAMSQALLTAFSTASSAATLPVSMECVEKNAKVSRRVSSFVLPLGATVNMDGTALYECVVVMFLAQMSGIHLDASTQFVVVLLALLTSIGVAGIPNASLVAIVIILNAVNEQLPMGQTIPLEAMAIILIFDRLLDMCRTAVNIFGDSVATVVIAKSEGEKGILES